MAICCNGERLGVILQNLLTALDNALVECNAAPCRLFLDVSDQPPWDICCQCADGSVGQAYVTVPTIRHLNQTDADTMRCQGIFEADVKIGVLRCALSMDERGNPPDQDAVSLQTLGVLRDRLAINQAIRCSFGALYDSDDWTLGDWRSLGPQGSCVGGQVDMTFRFADPKCS